MSNNGTKTQCENCGRLGASVRLVTRTYGKGETLLVVENVPVLSCSQCGASYMTAETLHQIAKIKLHRRGLTERREVTIAQFTS